MATEPSWINTQREIEHLLDAADGLPTTLDGGWNTLSPPGSFSLREDDSRTVPAVGCPENALSQTIPGDGTEPWAEKTGSSEERQPALWPFRASQGQGGKNPWPFSAITRLTHWPALALLLWEVTETIGQDSGLLQYWASQGHSEKCEVLRRMAKGTNTPQISAVI